jgi:hypothetical protein
MNADVKGALARINTSYQDFIHDGKIMSKIEVKAVLEYAVKKGYETTNDIPLNEIYEVLKNLK